MAGLALLTPALADNTGKKATLRVQLVGGKTHDATQVKFKKTKLQARGLGSVPYDQVVELSETVPPSEERAAKLRERYGERARKLETEDGKGWAKLGAWAKSRGLDEEAQRAYEQAVKLLPDDDEVRHALGQMEVDGAWVPAPQEIAKRRAALRKGDDSGLLKLAKLAAKNGAPNEAFAILSQLLSPANGGNHKGALKQLRPLTNAKRHRVSLRMPVAGRWKASEDKTRHHQKNVSAIYALDLVKVDEEGRHMVGRGKTLGDHFAWGEPVYAAAAGKVVWVQTDHPDLPANQLGIAKNNNGVGLDHGGGEITWYMHFQRGSCTLKMGDQVERGQLIGKVGNSGKSNIPHLHFALAWRGYMGLPWRVEELKVVAPDGTEIPAKNIAPREGWIMECPPPEEPEPKEDGE